MRKGLGSCCSIPALVAGIISDEYQRKTLHYLLASRLSSAEIVLGKLGARMVHVRGIRRARAADREPADALRRAQSRQHFLCLYGYGDAGSVRLGVFGADLDSGPAAARGDPGDVRPGGDLAAGADLAPGHFGLSRRHALVGTDCERRPAHEQSHQGLVDGDRENLQLGCRQAHDGRVARPDLVPAWTAGNGFEWEFGWMAGIQAIFGLLFLVLAIAGLRPLRGSSWPGAKPQTGWMRKPASTTEDGFERKSRWMAGIAAIFGVRHILAVAGLRPLHGSPGSGEKPRAGWWTRLRARYRKFVESRTAAAVTRNELLATRAVRPACGDNPMLWKERYTRMGGGLKWLGSRPVALFFTVFLGCYLFDVTSPVLADVVRLQWHDRDWYVMNGALRTSSFVLGILAMLPITAAAATSLTSEREQDTWTSLATTLLTPGEIVRAKQFGAIWSARWIGIALLVLWGAGLVLAGVHPIGLLAGVVILASSTWLVCSIGVFASSFAGNSIRALFISFTAMFVVMMASGWPVLLWSSLASYSDMKFLWTGYVPAGTARSTLITPPLGAAAVRLGHPDLRGLLLEPMVDQARAIDVGQGVSQPRQNASNGGRIPNFAGDAVKCTVRECKRHERWPGVRAFQRQSGFRTEAESRIVLGMSEYNHDGVTRLATGSQALGDQHRPNPAPLVRWQNGQRRKRQSGYDRRFQSRSQAR